MNRFLRTFVLLGTPVCIAALSPHMILAAQAPFSSLSAPQPAQQGNMAIAAVVNEEIITMFDVQSRVSLFIVTSGIDDSAEMRQRLVPQVVDLLIEERLKLQEAARLKLNTTEAEIRQAVDGLEQRNNMGPGSFRAMLQGRGVDMSVFFGQVDAEISWNKVIRESLQHDVNVSKEEVDAVLARARTNQGKPEYLLSEIALPLITPAQDQAIHDMAGRLVTQARGGTPFPNLAQQFSQSPTAALGGDLGWVVKGELEPELDDAVGRLALNQVSDPIRTATGYHILQLREKRTAGAPDPKMAIVTLNQIYLPTLGKRALPTARLTQLSDTISHFDSCAQMDKLGRELQTPGSGPIQPVYVGGLPPKVRDIVADLKPGHTSPAIEVGGARLFLQVCVRKDDTGVPSVDQITQNLETDKLQNAARQKLRDLRRAALIDVRI